MEAKLTRVDRHDAIGREEMLRIFESEPFKLVQDRMQVELKRATRTCVSNGDQLEVMRAQGAVAALEAALLMPARLIEELKR